VRARALVKTPVNGSAVVIRNIIRGRVITERRSQTRSVEETPRAAREDRVYARPGVL
jgi:hypothetical protein